MWRVIWLRCTYHRRKKTEQADNQENENHENDEEITYPLIGLVASGGHSHLYLAQQPGDLTQLGGTIDDAAGEAFDKAAAMLELGISRRSADRPTRSTRQSPKALQLPRTFLREERLSFSFSGLKTALLYKVRGKQGKDPMNLDAAGVADACASFQAAVVDCLAGKLIQAAEQQGVNTIAVGGGVACNGPACGNDYGTNASSAVGDYIYRKPNIVWITPR